jgi:SpoVK/Ycf46/Vps4 family AAA+-type ATPase
MTHWDGLASSTSSGTSDPQRICILGATNRIQDIDEAILRRMPKKFPVALPSAAQRHNIFSLILRGTKIDTQNFDLDYLVRISAGMSGSDIKEACRDAAMGPVREYIRRKKADGTLKSSRGVKAADVRGLRTEDFFGRGKGLRDLDTLDQTREEMNDKVRSRVHTTEEEEDDEDEEESEDATTEVTTTEEGSERSSEAVFRDETSSYHSARRGTTAAPPAPPRSSSSSSSRRPPFAEKKEDRDAVVSR